MTINEMQEGVPQTTEDIEGIEWNTLENSAHCLSHTYDNIREVIDAYTKKMRGF
jgi:NifU-like protein involved in Fe-S cluster formation